MDSLRAIAALGVVLTHVFVFTGVVQHHWWGAVPANLSVGVSVFFVLSGFLLYRPFFNAELTGAPRPRLRDFARRRVLRIVPAYWVALTVLAIYPGVPGVFGPEWWRYYGLLQVYWTHTAQAGLGVAWTLCIEVSFYLLLPFYAVAASRLTRRLSPERRVRAQLGLLGAGALVSVVLRYALQSAPWQNSLPTHWLWFSVGMALAVLSVAHQAAPRPGGLAGLVAAHPLACWGAALVAYLVMCALLTSAPQHLFYSRGQALWLHLGNALVAGALVAPAVFGSERRDPLRRLLAWRALAWLGLISYGIYLWHATIAVELVSRGVQQWWELLPIALALAVACAALSYYVVERPLLRLKDAWPRRRRARPAPGPEPVR
jgi:peptidoglycan/LPS O-acetylase OafA/YrhL